MTQNPVYTLSIAVPCPLPQCFNYLPLPNIDLIQLTPGVRVKVPFGKRNLIGIFLGVETNPQIDHKKLKHISQVLDHKAIFSPILLSLLRWMSDYYHHPLGEVFATALPNLARKEENLKPQTLNSWHITQKGQNLDAALLKNSPKQKALLEKFKESSKITTADFLESGHSKQSLNALLKKQLICIKELPLQPLKSKGNEKPPILNIEQKAAVDSVLNSLNQFAVFLLQGITGSGKTEVFLQLINQSLIQKKQVLVLVPEIGLTPQTISRFQNRFNATIALMHSNLTEKERLQNWLWCQENKIQIVIGTRSALFSPLNNLGLIIIDEEHDASFKQQESIRYSARDVAIYYAKQLDVPILLASATPSLETYYNCKIKRFSCLRLTKRAGSAMLPELKLIDMRTQKTRNGFSHETLATMKNHLDKNNQVLLFINRRGYAPSLLCYQCNFVFTCSRCDSKLTFHSAQNKLLCHLCGKSLLAPTDCPQCKVSQLNPVGFGTQRIEETLTEVFPQYSIVRIDKDTTRKKGSLTNKLEKINNKDYRILIGTQMLAKGHHFPSVSLAIIINADAGLLGTDLRASERMGQLITQVAGRSGREKIKGEVIIQTYQPNNPLLQILVSQDYDAFLEQLLLERKEANMPPFSYIALIRAEAHLDKDAFEFLNQIYRSVTTENNSKLTFLGPIKAPIQKKAGKVRCQLLIQSDDRIKLQHALKKCHKIISNLKISNKVKWSIDVDPLDFF